MQDLPSSGLSRRAGSDAGRRKIRSASLPARQERPKESVVQDCGAQNYGSFGPLCKKSSDSSRQRTLPESLDFLQGRPKELVVPGCGLQDYDSFGRSCERSSDSGRKRTLSESLDLSQDRPKKRMVSDPQSRLETNGLVPIRPAETVALCTPVGLTGDLPDLSPPVFCETLLQIVDRTYSHSRDSSSQSNQTSDSVAGSTIQKRQSALGGNGQSLVKFDVDASNDTGEIRRCPDSFGVISPSAHHDLGCGRPHRLTRVGFMEPCLSKGPKGQKVAGGTVQSSEVDAQTARPDHPMVGVVASSGPSQIGFSTMDFEDCMRREREIHDLSKEACDLGQRQRECVLTSQRLEQRIAQGELAYGEMLRQTLELRRALEKRRQHISEDKSSLERERMSAKSMDARIHAILAKIMSITKDGDTGCVKHES